MHDDHRLHLIQRRAPQGSAMVLVLVAVATATVLGLTFLVTSTTATAVTEHVHDHIMARHIAESGVALAMAYIEKTPTWRKDRPQGTWVINQPLMGGTFSLSGTWINTGSAPSPELNNSSFESQNGSLPTPLLFPPMSGTIGGWHLQRTGLLQPLTGATVPQVGIQSSVLATDGNRLAYVSFPLSVLGTATFSQTLNMSLHPETHYALKVDVIDLHVGSVLPDLEFRVLAGGTLVATSSTASLLKILDLNSDTREYSVRFKTGPTPPTGNIRVELHARSLLGLLAGVGFDRVRLEVENNDPITFTVDGRYGESSHTATVTVLPPGNGPARVINWLEP